jgi:transcriptional regulator with GAF, ATPase, and Fis domain
MPVQLIGTSPAFKQVIDAIAMVAPVDSAVLLLGGRVPCAYQKRRKRCVD